MHSPHHLRYTLKVSSATALRLLRPGLITVISAAFLLGGAWRWLTPLSFASHDCTITQRDRATMPGEADPPTRARVSTAYGQLPLQFEANQGQVEAQVQFLARGGGYSLFLTATEAVLRMRNEERLSISNPQSAIRNPQPAVLRMKLTGAANPEPQITGLEQLPGKVNYFMGNDTARWRTDIPTYARVRYQEVYPGIDLVYYGNQQQLEYDFVISPGADPRAIGLDFEGADRIEIDAQGNLVLYLAGGQVTQHRPIIYQEVDGAKQQVPGAYVLTGAHQVGFQIGDYDASRPLVIDPVLAYSTYYGGLNFESGRAIAVDAAGNAYVTGLTFSTNRGNGGDVFVVKLNASGQHVYAGYFGGTNAPQEGLGIGVDGAGNAYVVGITSADDFPVRNAFQPRRAGQLNFADAFVTKINAAGNDLAYSTYLGGSGAELDINTDPRGAGIAVDDAGNAYLIGTTRSTDFPTTPDAFQRQLKSGSPGFTPNDVFAAKFDPAGARVYSTYLGGNSEDVGYSIAVDSAGQAYLTGWTRSGDFPRQRPLKSQFSDNTEAFVTKLNATGSALIFSTFFGGLGEGRAIAVDSAGNAYLTGLNYGGLPATPGVFQTTPGGDSDAFVAKLSAQGDAVVYATFLGGNRHDRGYAIAVDKAGQACVTGMTAFSPMNGFPTRNPLQDPKDNLEAFVTKLDSNGDAIYSSYFGGNRSDRGYGIATDQTGNVYLTGETESPDFPIKNALQPTGGPGGDAFIAKISDESTTAGADLALAKSHTGSFTVGANGVYTLSVTNVGSAATTGTITVTDTLPNGLSFVSGTGASWSCTASNQTVTCTNPGPIAAGASSSITLTVGVSPAAVPNVINTATVSNESDTNTANNTASDPTDVTAAPNPVPTLSSLTPNSATAGSTAFMLTVTGTNFIPSSVVRWNGSDRPADFVSNTQLTAQIAAADIAAAGTASVTVFNPAPGGGASSALSFAVSRAVRVVDTSALFGGTVKVPIILNAAGDETGMQFSLSYDPNLLSNPQVEPGSDVKNNFSFFEVNDTQAAQGRLGILLLLKDKFAAGPRQVAVVTFTVTGSANESSTQIGFADAPIPRLITDANAGKLAATYLTGTVTFSSGFEADADGDNLVTVADAQRISLFAAGKPKPSAGSLFQRADCAPRETKGDGLIDLTDVVQAMRYAAGKDGSPVPAGGPTGPITTLAASMGAAVGHVTSGTASARMVRAVSAGQANALTVELEAQGDEVGLGFSLQYDPHLLRFAGATLGSGASHGLLTVNDDQAASGRLGLLLALPPGQRFASGRQAMVRIQFIAFAESPTTARISFGDDPIARQVVDEHARPVAATYFDATITINSRAVASLSAASFSAGELASEVIAAAFGAGLAITTQAAATIPLPTSLAGTTVSVKDGAGVERFAPLFFVSPDQINYLIPEGTLPGTASVTVTSGDGKVSTMLDQRLVSLDWTRSTCVCRAA